MQPFFSFVAVGLPKDRQKQTVSLTVHLFAFASPLAVGEVIKTQNGWTTPIDMEDLPLAKACQSLAKRCGVLARHAELPGARFRQNAAVIAVDCNVASLMIDQPDLLIVARPFSFPYQTPIYTNCTHEATIIKKSRSK